MHMNEARPTSIILSYEATSNYESSQVGSSEFSRGHHVVIACVEHNSLLIFNCFAQIEHLSPRYSYVHLCIL